MNELKQTTRRLKENNDEQNREWVGKIIEDIRVIERSAAVENPNQQITKGVNGAKFLTLRQNDQGSFM